MKRLFTVTVILIVLITSFVIFSLFNVTQKRTQLKMGTFVEIVLSGPAWSKFDEIFDKAFLEIDRIENLATRFKKDSQI